jgi:hypothetical protein
MTDTSIDPFCRPPPPWEPGEHVSFFVADQTYEWVRRFVFEHFFQY